MLERPRNPAHDEAEQVRNRLAALTGRLVPQPPAASTAGRLVERWLPPAGVRVMRGRAGRLILIVVAVVAAVVVAAGLWWRRPVIEQPPAVSPPVASSSAVHGDKPGEPEPIVVNVVGKVVHPGLVTLRDGARVADAVRAAGGPTQDADLTTVNLARKLSDGEQVAVGVPAAAESPDRPLGKVDLNTATAEQLQELPGVGPTTAKRILQWRTKHGRFASVDQLREVDGIGTSKFGRLKDLVRT